MWYKLFRYIRGFLVVAIIVIAIFSSVFRACTPWILQYKGNLEAYLSKTVGEPVSIQAMETGWYWFYPVLKLQNIYITEEKKLVAKKMWMGVNLIRSLWHWQIEPGVLYIDTLKVVARQKEDAWQIDGFPRTIHSNVPLTESYQGILMWLFGQQKIIIRDAEVKLYDKNGKILPISCINLSLVNRNGSYVLEGKALLGKEASPNTVLLGEIKPNFSQKKIEQGEIYLSLQGIQLQEWQSLLPFQLKGSVNTRWWIDFRNAAISNVQASVQLQDFSWKEIKKPRQFLKSFQANLKFTPQKDGWEWTGDGVKMDFLGKEWPENRFAVRYQTSQDAYHLYLQHLLLAPLYPSFRPFLQTIFKSLPSRVKGELQDTEIRLIHQKPVYVLTKFVNISANAFLSIPAFSNLSGALYWQPGEGRFDIHGTPTLHPYHQKPVTFSALELGLWWQDAQFTVDKFLLQHPALSVTAHGAFSGVKEGKAEKMDLVLEGAAEQLEQWFPYFSKLSFVPIKIRQWIAQHIKKISKINTSITFHGKLEDFPFDKGEGEWKMDSTIEGMDLFFLKDWPLNKNIHARVTIDKNNLSGNVLEADVGGMKVQAISLSLPNIGKEENALFLQGKWNTPTARVLSYLLKTPLAPKLQALKSVSTKGRADIDIQVKVPVGKQKTTITGNVQLKNNEIEVKSFSKPLPFQNVDGSLRFRQEGIVSSQLEAKIFGFPIRFLARSLPGKNPGTEIKIIAETELAFLQQQLQSPFLAVLHGKIAVESLLILKENPEDVDTLQINSNLRGVAVDLPAPLGKKEKEDAVFSIKAYLPRAEGMNIDLAYKNMRVMLKKQQEDTWAIGIKHPDILGQLVYSLKENTLRGNMAKLVLIPNAKQSNKAISLRPSAVPSMDIRVDDLRYGKWSLGRGMVKGGLKKDTWVLENATLATPFYQLVLQGQWHPTHTQIEAKANIKNLGATLEKFHLARAIETQKGQAYFRGQWQGGLADFSLAKVEGSLSLVLKEGRISDFSKGVEGKLGLGKLLSILSLQTIPRRLKLDFTDLSQTGYSFDIFKGDFLMHKGLMKTQNSYIDGPIAYVSMQGDLDIVHQLYNLQLKVAPHIAASLPIVATIAGGPIAGLATWAASKIINQGMKLVSGYTYKITGPWKTPLVKQVSITHKAIH